MRSRARSTDARSDVAAVALNASLPNPWAPTFRRSANPSQFALRAAESLLMEPPSRPRIVIINLTGRRRRLVAIRSAAEAVLAGQTRSVEVVLTSDATLQELNRDRRGLDEPTDVLTFCAPDFPRSPLGEILISVPYAERQAKQRGISIEAELCYLVIHGALHLLGFEDETETGCRLMQAEMARWGERLGLPAQPEWTSVLHEVAP